MSNEEETLINEVDSGPNQEQKSKTRRKRGAKKSKNPITAGSENQVDNAVPDQVSKPVKKTPKNETVTPPNAGQLPGSYKPSVAEDNEPVALALATIPQVESKIKPVDEKNAKQSKIKSKKSTNKSGVETKNSFKEKSAKKFEKVVEKAKNETPQKKPEKSNNKGQIRFPPHYIKDQVKMALEKNLLLRGVLRINPKMFEDAYVTTDEYNDIFISGILNRNRSLNGDEIAVDLFPESEWRILHGSVAEYLEDNGLNDIPGGEVESGAEEDLAIGTVVALEDLSECEDDDYETDGEDVLIENVEIIDDDGDGEVEVEVAEKKTRRGTRGSRKRSEKSNNKEFKIEDVKRLPNWMKFVQKCGRVVAILDKVHKRHAVGYLKDSVGDSKFAVFSPIDSRVPRILIPRHDLPQDFVDRPQDYTKTLFVAKINFWDQPRFAMGRLVQNLGDDSCIDNCTTGILMENDVDDSEFSEGVTGCLPQLPFVIGDDEIAKRRDFRNECVFTIDPLTARDLDDALSIENINEDTYKVGVHIADVAHFVLEETELDSVANSRSTSVYLVQKVIPMLPRILCENLCSLNPGEDRLTFSVEWIIKESGEIVDSWFGKSVINSCVKLAYEHAQEMLDDPGKEWDVDQLPEIKEPWTVKDVSTKVNMLNKISLNLKQKRIDAGILKLDNPKLCFRLDKETGLPQGFQPYKTRQSNSLIEEFMLLANISVAEKIYKHFPGLSLLRCHPAPKQNMIDGVITLLQRYGIHLDASSSKRLAETLALHSPNGVSGSEAKYQLLLNMCSKPMQNARYFCSGWYDNPEEYRHYALSVPFYTHFTSPIRRYPDIIVHRLLHAAITGDELSWEKSTIQKTANHCNIKKLNAKKCSQESEELFFANFIKVCGPLDAEGVVLKVLDHSLDCLLTDISLVKRVYFDSQIVTKVIDRISPIRGQGGVRSLEVYWAAADGVEAVRQVCNVFSPIKLQLISNPKKVLSIKAELQRPN